MTNSVGDWGPGYFTALYGRVYAGPLRDDRATMDEAGYVEEALESARDAGTILDLGAGFGRHARELTRRGFRVLALDRFAHLLRAMPKTGRAAVCGDMRRLPLADASLAGAYCIFNTFGYFSDEDNAHVLDELARTLRPGARFVLQVPNRPSMARIVRETPPSQTLGPDYTGTEAYEYDAETHRMNGAGAWLLRGETQYWDFSLRLYTMAELERLLKKRGFDIVDAHGDYDGTPFNARSSQEIVLVVERRGSETR